MGSKQTFTVFVMGSTGGPFEGNLSGYLIAPYGSHDFIALDAGTLLEGIEKIYQKGFLNDFPLKDKDLSPVGHFFLRQVKAYLISHAHLDHVCGLVINSQVDAPKSIFGTDCTIDHLRDHLFNGKIWPNYANEGEAPLNHYAYHRLQNEVVQHVPGTEMTIESFPLSHPGDYLSTAFLIGTHDHFFLYFGDTSSDFLEKKKRLARVWERIAPLVVKKTLKGMFLECSYPGKYAANTRYGHLDPSAVQKELSHLESIAGTSLREFPIIVTHRKGSLLHHEDPKHLIARELLDDNPLGIQWIFPEQGDRIIL